MNFVALDGFPNFTFPARETQTHKGALYLIPPRVTHFYPIPPKIGPKMAFFYQWIFLKEASIDKSKSWNHRATITLAAFQILALT